MNAKLEHGLVPALASHQIDKRSMHRHPKAAPKDDRVFNSSLRRFMYHPSFLKYSINSFNHVSWLLYRDGKPLDESMDQMTLKLAGAIGLILIVGLAFWLWTPDRTRAELEAHYLHSPLDLVDLDGFRLNVRDTGPKSAPSIILLHGFGSSLQTWDGWAGPLERNYRVIRFDLPGVGLSDPDPTGDYTDARTHTLILKLMDKLTIQNAVFVGNSLGGRVAWTFAAKHPERVSNLVLISPDGFASPGFPYGQKANVPILLSIMSYALPKALFRPNIEAAYSDPKRLSEAVLDRYYDLTLAPGSRKALLARMQQTVLVDPRPILPKITQPVLLLWGRKDALIPIANAQDYLKALPNASLVTFDDLGHVPHEEDAASSLLPLLAFLGNIQPR